MDIKEIKEIAELMKEMDLSVIELKEGEKCVRLERQGTGVLNGTSPVPAFMPQQSLERAAGGGVQGKEDAKLITSPMVGVYYSAASPDAKPFVSIGEKVKAGDVLCIIEAMKLMNEITAEQSGVVAEIFAENGQVVEFGQPLFRLN